MFWVKGEKEAVFVWLVPSMLLSLFMLMIAVSQREAMSRRVKRAIPRRFALRVLAFPFYTDPVSGVIWAMGIALVPLLAVVVLFAYTSMPGHLSEALSVWSIIWVYGICYCLTAGFVNRVCIPGTSKSGAPWVIVLYFLAAGMLLPSIVEQLYDSGHITWRMKTQWGNIFAMAWESQRDLAEHHLAFGLGWLALLAILNAPWARRHIADFRPETPAAAPDTAPESMPPVVPPPAARVGEADSISAHD